MPICFWSLALKAEAAVSCVRAAASTGSIMAKVHRLMNAVLRLAAAAAAATAAVVMVTSRETTSFFGIQMEAKYSYTPSFM